MIKYMDNYLWLGVFFAVANALGAALLTEAPISLRLISAFLAGLLCEGVLNGMRWNKLIMETLDEVKRRNF